MKDLKAEHERIQIKLDNLKREEEALRKELLRIVEKRAFSEYGVKQGGRVHLRGYGEGTIRHIVWYHNLQHKPTVAVHIPGVVHEIQSNDYEVIP